MMAKTKMGLVLITHHWKLFLPKAKKHDTSARWGHLQK